jgi:hypothetical protein
MTHRPTRTRASPLKKPESTSARSAGSAEKEKPAQAGSKSRSPHDTRERAKHLLVHRANGGIHNAALAMRFVTARVPSTGELPRDLATFIAAGLRGTADAARALQLLAALDDLESATLSAEGGPYVGDVATLLSAESRRQGKSFAFEAAERGLDTPTLQAGQASKMLIAALSALEDAEAGSILALSVRARPTRTAKPWELKIRKKEPGLAATGK